MSATRLSSSLPGRPTDATIDNAHTLRHARTTKRLRHLINETANALQPCTLGYSPLFDLGALTGPELESSLVEVRRLRKVWEELESEIEDEIQAK